MATQSVQQDFQGPDWPLGLIAVSSPGTPVGLMSLVDPNGINDPASPTPGTSGAAPYTVRCNQIQITALKAGASHGLTTNAGNIYIMRKGVQGAGNRDDYGAMVACLLPGQSITIIASPLNRDVLSPYRYSIDADNSGDSALVTLFIA